MVWCYKKIKIRYFIKLSFLRRFTKEKASSLDKVLADKHACLFLVYLVSSIAMLLALGTAVSLLFFK